MIRDDTRRETDEHAPAGAQEPRRWAYGWVGLALFSAIIALTGGAFLLDHQFRPPVNTEPAGGIATATEQTPAPPDVTLTPASGTTPSLPTLPNDPLEREIVEAYLHYWEVRIQAYYDLDASLLPQVLSGPKLLREQEQMQEFREQGKAVKVDVEHHLLLVEVAPDRALVYDEYFNQSVFIDSATKEELPTKEPPGTEKVSYEMRKIDGIWKVVDGRQHR